MKSYLLLLSILFSILVDAQTKYSWVGGNGNWSNAAKWSPAGVPGALDTAVITIDGNYRVTVDQNNVTVAGVKIGYPGSGSTFTQELYMDGKTFTVNDSIIINIRGKMMLWNGSTLIGPGKITNYGKLFIRQSTVDNDIVNKSSGTLEAYSQSYLNGNFVNEGFFGIYAPWNYGGSTVLAIANGFTNEGTIKIRGENMGSSVYNVSLIVTSGSLINNNKLISEGTLFYGSGTNYLKAELINNDSLLIYGRPLNLDKPGAHQINNGYMHIMNQREFNILQSGSNPYFNNNGMIVIDSDCDMVFKSGTLNINSNNIECNGVLVVKDTCIANLNVDYTISENSKFDVRSLATINGPGVITNQGTLLLFNGNINSNLINSVSGYIQASDQSYINGDIVNEGFLESYGTSNYGGSAVLTIANGFTNEGILRLWGDNTGSSVSNSTIIVTNGPLTNNNRIISEGTMFYGSGRNFLKAELINNDSVIISSRNFTLDKTDASHANNGFMQIKRSSSNSIELNLLQSGSSPSFKNFGTFKIDSTNTLKLSQGSFVNQNSGIICGIGKINSQNGNLNNKGLFLPGDNIGTFSVTGNYPEESTSVLKIDIGGYSAGSEHDRLNVSGNASLSGSLNINIVNGFTPAVGDSFLVLTYGSRTGSFSSIVDSSFVSGAEWDTIYTNNGLYIKLIDSPTIIEGTEDENLPTEFALNQNYPNPFNPSTKIQYSIPEKSNVALKVYDILGNEVAILVNEEKERGVYSINFDATGLASGMYLYRLQAGSFVETRKMILIR
ncbi:MAG: T9SS type A sorting domain-containing protein [Ignavibacteriaceae bacterium]|jgi:hypothetical protein|nr:T9SS type A sorting domain-containing protein [Ignavibacteriaceae bacterium]